MSQSFRIDEADFPVASLDTARIQILSAEILKKISPILQHRDHDGHGGAHSRYIPDT